LQRHREEFLVPGPNWVWSVDGHMKLQVYGFEIYAGIDAYSKYIVWIYMGVSARTAVSVLKQYLNIVSVPNAVMPAYIRSDRGTETMLCANAHFHLSKAVDPDLQFQECYIYGTSTNNQRIEA
jgi:hypothetical protein